MRLINIKGYIRKGRFIKSSQRKLTKAKLISKSTYQLDDVIENRIVGRIPSNYKYPSKNNPAKLSKAEQYSIAEYSDSRHYELNRSLRGIKVSKTKSQALQDEINAIRSGLTKLPSTTNKTLYRGVRTTDTSLANKIYKQYEIDSVVTEPSFLSTGIADENHFGDLLKYKIVPKTKSNGKVLGEYSVTPAENEVLFSPNTSFKVANKYKEGKTRWIELHEL